MTDEAGFLAHISANPADRVARLAYADWLEEQGDELALTKAQYLRTEDSLQELPDDDTRNPLILQLRSLAEALSTDWKAVVARVPIEGCDLKWQFQCPKKWESLRPAFQIPRNQKEKSRYCTACHSKVYYCDDLETAIALARSECCIAIDLKVLRRENDLPQRATPSENRDSTVMGFMQEPSYDRMLDYHKNNPLPNNHSPVRQFLKRVISRFGFGS